jgi:hypothetical protein
VLQKLLRAAYQGALSYPLIPELEDLHRINAAVLADFVAQHYTGRHGKQWICVTGYSYWWHTVQTGVGVCPYVITESSTTQVGMV